MKDKILTALGIVLMIGAVVLATTSYARFVSGVKGTANITLARWEFTANDETMSFSSDLGELYPGIDKYFQVILSAENSDVDVDYKIKFNYPNNIPENLKFYSDSAKTQEINLDGDTLSGILTAGKRTVITIYYDWPYGSAAEKYTPGTAWFNMTIDGHQKDPSGGV